MTYDGTTKPLERAARDAARAAGAAGALMSPLARLRAIREKAFFAHVQNTLGEECVAVAEGLPIAAREAKLGQADMHFEAFHQTVDQLVALICGDEEALAQLDMIELHCGVLSGAGEG